MLNYEIVESLSAVDLEERVNKRITKGYKPQGGVSTIHRGTLLYFHQAIILAPTPRYSISKQ